MELTMEELVPVVGKLAEKYTAYEHTSMSYEEARQLMQAVQYCIQEAEKSGNQAAVVKENMTAWQIYEAGAVLVEEKSKKALELYNEITPDFVHFGNHCLYDTVIMGLPEFFKWYDMKFCPQDTILTLDYPVLKDLSGLTGIDKIYEFILCIRAEQRFLNLLPEAYVRNVLQKHDSRYEDMVENICGIVLTDIAGHVIAEKPLTEGKFTEEEYRKIQGIWEQPGIFEAEEGPKTHNGREQPGVLTAKEQVSRAVASLVQECLEDAEEISQYLDGALEDIFVRLGAAAEYGTISSLL